MNELSIDQKIKLMELATKVDTTLGELTASLSQVEKNYNTMVGLILEAPTKP